MYYDDLTRDFRVAGIFSTVVALGSGAASYVFGPNYPEADFNLSMLNVSAGMLCGGGGTLAGMFLADAINYNLGHPIRNKGIIALLGLGVGIGAEYIEIKLAPELFPPSTQQNGFQQSKSDITVGNTVHWDDARRMVQNYKLNQG